MATQVNITFKGGLGSVTVKLFRNGTQIDQGSIDKSGIIQLKDTVPFDAISVDGVSPDKGTDISFSVKTNPASPTHIIAGPIFRDFDVL